LSSAGLYDTTYTAYLSRQFAANDLEKMTKSYEGRSKSFATQYNAQMTQANFLRYYSTQSPLTPMHMLHLSKSSFMPVKYNYDGLLFRYDSALSGLLDLIVIIEQLLQMTK